MSSRTFAAAIRLLRPRQWVKNTLVLVPMAFAATSFADVLRAVLPAALTFAAFCLVASAVYALNDVIDAEQDRVHPAKRARPVASGALGANAALAIAAACATAGLALSGLVSWAVTAYLVGYIVNNYAYSTWLKHVQLFDVFSISLGFLLRVFAGAAAVGVPVSAYLFLTVLFLTLFLGLGKRRHELNLLADGGGAHRGVLESYSVYYLDQLMVVAATMTLVLYTMYTLVEAAAGLVATVPVVTFGIFRYYHLTHNLDRGEPSDDLVGDRWILASAAAFAALVLWRLARSA